MGVDFKGLVKPIPVTAADFRDRRLAIDADNHLYQFLTAIRSSNGEPISDSRGRPVSHLLGLFSRSVNLMKNGIQLVYVFDGEPSELKSEVLTQRKKSRQSAAVLYREAEERGDIETMKREAARSSRLLPQMIEEAKDLITALGAPIVQSPSEADAQAAAMVCCGDCYAVSSTDYDPLLHGAERLVRRLTGREKPQANAELIELSTLLDHLEIDQEQLLALAIMIGTDYNPGGIRGIGPKKGLKLLKEKPVEEVSEAFETEFDWAQIAEAIREMPVTSDYNLEWRAYDAEAVRKLLIDDHDFSEERVENALTDLDENTG